MRLPEGVMAPALSQRRTWLVVLAILVPVFLGSLDLTVVSAFLPRLIDDLAIPLDGLGLVAWVLTSYFLFYALSLFVMGRVSDLIGRRPALTICLLLYVAGSGLIVGFEAPADLILQLAGGLNLPIDTTTASVLAIVVARSISAFGAGAVTAIALALVGDLFEPRRRDLPLGIVIVADTVGWLIGAVWGGLIVQVLPWRAIFLINIPLMLIGLGLVLWALHPLKPAKAAARSGGRIDVWGALLLTAALISLNVGLSNLSSGGSGIDFGRLIPPLVIAGGLLVAFAVVERRTREPLLDLRLLRLGKVASATILNLLIGVLLFIPLVSIPLLVNLRGLVELGLAALLSDLRDTTLQNASLEAGLLIAAFTLPVTIAALLGARLLGRFSITLITLGGLGLASVGFGLLAFGLALESQDLPIVAMLGVTGFGIGLTFTPIVSVTLAAVGGHQYGMASALVLATRIIGMMIATSALSAYGTQRVVDLVAAVEQGQIFFELVPTRDYALVFTQTYVNASIQTINEMMLAGLMISVLGLLPGWGLARRSSASG
ncbi:MAG: MFS transporter [Chloroflexi bacterium]|nr:MFS transporter [Chloroflexota bacterium]